MVDRRIRPEPVAAPESVTLLRMYFTEMVARYVGRDATAAEVDAALAEDPSGDLTPPGGIFLVLREDSRPSGCVALRFAGDTAELNRLFVLDSGRASGAGGLLVTEAERTACEWGARRVRLDTRNDLVEARALYTSRGYAEIPAYNAAPYAEHWFEKVLPS